jgi:ABC-type uncharacterized transport system ATPase subunit
VKLLSGVVQPYHGAIHVAGNPFIARDPASVQAIGIVTVFQKVLVAPDRSVVDNVLTGIGGALVLTELNTPFIGISLQAAAVQTALGIVIVALVFFYGREPHVRTTI